MKTKVHATHPNSLNIAHPIDGKLKPEGSHWEDDGFTARMIADGAVTTDPPKVAVKPPPPDAATTK
jgi:hypothetical protein